MVSVCLSGDYSLLFHFWHSIRYILVKYKRYKKMGEFYNPDKLYKGGSRNNSLINKKNDIPCIGSITFY